MSRRGSCVDIVDIIDGLVRDVLLLTCSRSPDLLLALSLSRLPVGDIMEAILAGGPWDE